MYVYKLITKRLAFPDSVDRYRILYSGKKTFNSEVLFMKLEGFLHS